MNIDFLLVCGVTFSPVCLLLYDHLTLLIFYVGSVPILSSIWMFLMATAVCKFIIITRSLPQTNILSLLVSFSVAAGVSVVCLSSAFSHTIFPRRELASTHAHSLGTANSQLILIHRIIFNVSANWHHHPPPKRWKWFCEMNWVVNLQCPGNEHVCSPILFKLWSCRMPHRYFVQSFLSCQFSDCWFFAPYLESSGTP